MDFITITTTLIEMHWRVSCCELYLRIRGGRGTLLGKGKSQVQLCDKQTLPGVICALFAWKYRYFALRTTKREFSRVFRSFSVLFKLKRFSKRYACGLGLPARIKAVPSDRKHLALSNTFLHRSDQADKFSASILPSVDISQRQQSALVEFRLLSKRELPQKCDGLHFRNVVCKEEVSY